MISLHSKQVMIQLHCKQVLIGIHFYNYSLRWQGRQYKFFNLFLIGCFGTYEIHLSIFCIAANTHNNIMEMEKAVPYFLQMCANHCYYSGNRGLRILQASIPPFQDVHDPCLHEGTFKNELFFNVDTLFRCVS